MRRLTTSLWALLAVLAAFPSAAAAASFERCPRFEEALCTTVTVPIDRSGAVPGSIPLHVEKVPALGGRSRGAIVALAGGPGQAASPFTGGFAGLLESVIERRDLVVLDQRGTGRSGVLRCPGLERLFDPDAGEQPQSALAPAVTACAAELGPRRAFYRTRDSADDIEDLRRDLGVDRISLFGVSYGTKVALDYASRYPEHVDRMVLDSVVRPEGPDALSRESIAATPRVLRDICRTGCPGVTADPAADLAALVGRLGQGPLVGTRVGPSGIPRPAEVKGNELLNFLISGDLLPELRTLVPGAVKGALDGDLAPLLRLTGAGAQGPPEQPEQFSEAVFAATLCEELDFPYRRSASPDERLEEARRRVDRMPDEAFYPFDRRTALEAGLVSLCAGWPKSGRHTPQPSDDDPLPAVPTLLFSGEADLRTPLEGAQRVAERIPGAALVSAPGLGHSVLGQSFDLCPDEALERLFSTGATSTRCEASSLGRVPPPSPASLDRVRPAAGVSGRRGRTLTAAVRTVEDVFLAFFLNGTIDEPADERNPFALSGRGGGLRGGRFAIRTSGVPGSRGRRRFETRLTLDRVVFVPGVRVSGNLVLNDEDAVSGGHLRISGPAAAPGAITVGSGRGGYRVSGRLAGRSVRSRVSRNPL